METLTVEISDEVAERIKVVAWIRTEEGKPTTPERLAARWLRDYALEHSINDLLRFESGYRENP